MRAIAFGLLSISLLTSPVLASVAAAKADDESVTTEEAKIGDTNSLFRDAAGPLGLTPDQRKRLQAISKESREQAATIQAELQAGRDDLKRLLEEEEPDFASVMAQVDVVGAVETRMRKHQIATLMALRAVLSSEQRAGLMDALATLAARDAANRALADAKAVQAARADTPGSPDASTGSDTGAPTRETPSP